MTRLNKQQQSFTKICYNRTNRNNNKHHGRSKLTSKMNNNNDIINTNTDNILTNNERDNEDENNNTRNNNIYDMEKNYNMWKVAVGDFCGRVLFQYVQFIASLEEIEYGSKVQQVVCNSLKIQDSYHKSFWDRVGMRECKEALRRKRQTITLSMKTKFQGNYNYFLFNI